MGELGREVGSLLLAMERQYNSFASRLELTDHRLDILHVTRLLRTSQCQQPMINLEISTIVDQI